MPLNSRASSPDDGIVDYWGLIEKAQASIPTAISEVDMEASHLVMSLNRATRTLIYDLEFQTLRPLGQSDSSFRLLFTLWVAGPLSPHRVAALASMARPTVTSLVATLRRDGLVDRQVDPADGRGAMLSLTPAGTQVITEAFEAHNRRERDWASLLTPIERKLFIMLMDKLMSGRASINAVDRR